MSRCVERDRMFETGGVWIGRGCLCGEGLRHQQAAFIFALGAAQGLVAEYTASRVIPGCLIDSVSFTELFQSLPSAAVPSISVSS